MTTALVSKPDVSILYMSRRSELRLVKAPRYPIYGIGGQTIGEKAGETVAFHDGVFRCPTSGTVVLEDGREADAAEVMQFLEKHRVNGSIEEGFWRVDPTAPPVSIDEMELVVNAGIDGDVPKLENILQQEQEGWQREDLLKSVRHALARVKEQAGPKPEKAQPQADPKPEKKD